MRKLLLASAFMLICTLASMATAPSGHGGKAMSEFKFKAQQQVGALPQSNLTYFRDLTSPEEKERLARKGIFVSHSFNGQSTEKERIFQPKVPMREDEQKYTLTVNLKYSKEEVMSVNGTAFPNYAEGYWFFSEQPEEEMPEMLEFKVPEGSYDINVRMRTMYNDFILLTATDVNVAGDTEITLDAADATVEIVWNPLLPDGTTPTKDITVYDPTTFEVLEYIQGNVLGLTNFLKIYNAKHNVGSTIMSDPWSWIIDDTKYDFSLCNIRTMPNNDYAFYFEETACGEDGGCIISLVGDASESREVTNNVADYITLKPEYAFTPYQPEPLIFGEGEDQEVFEFDKNKRLLLRYASFKKGILTGIAGAGIFNKYYDIKQWIYLCQDPKMAGEYEIMPIPALMEDWNNYMLGQPINTTGNPQSVLAINNTSEFNPYQCIPDDRNIYLSEATNPYLSFDVAKPHVWNYGCPTLVFSTTGTEWGSSFNFAYIGRLGENRGVDLLSTMARVAVNDAAPSDEVLENLQWGQLPDEGKIDFEFTDTNVAIDGIAGKNVARVGFDMSRPDWMPPTLQLVRFVDTEGNFTDRYGKGDEGVVEFYGGDFIYHVNNDTYTEWYTEEAAAEVKVEYAPYGTEEFLPLEVENIPERDFMPGFGTYYRGSLASVDRKSGNGWFDVRITLADASGNYQEQTLSPAFYVEDCVGVESLLYPEIAVRVADGRITAYGCEHPVIEVYSTDGTLLARANGVGVDASGYGRGIYLVKVTDGTKKVVRKVRL